jgi:hypothetical protein
MKLKEDEILTIDTRYVENKNNISEDLVKSYIKKASRFSTDPTYELCQRRCEKCKSLCRYTRDPRKNILFICSNSECRNVEN